MDDGNKYKVRLRDGVMYDPTLGTGPAPSPETVAWGLAGLNRYGGHTLRHLTVAEHSLWVAVCIACSGHDNATFKVVADMFGNGRIDEAVAAIPLHNAAVAIIGLCHDGPEGCGLVDVPSPITRHTYMDEYKAAHDRCARWLSLAWGIQPPPWPSIVKETDHSILGAEMAVRPGSDDKLGSGERILPWPNLDLAGRHDLSKHGTIFVREAWIATFYHLQSVKTDDSLTDGRSEESSARLAVSMRILNGGIP